MGLIPSEASEKYNPILMNRKAKLRHVYDIHTIFSTGIGITFLILAGILSDNDDDNLYGEIIFTIMNAKRKMIAIVEKRDW